jgi:hypothetical protein
MSLRARLMRRSTLTGLGASFFTVGIVLLFVVLFHETTRSGPLAIITAALLVGAFACWIAAARAGKPES